MTSTNDKQPEEAAVISTPQKTNNGASLVQKLAELRARHLTELRAARKKAKANFLRPI